MNTRVLVTGVGGRSVGAGILHALMRTDADVRARWETVATDADPFSWGLYLADRQCARPASLRAEYLDRIHELIDAHEIAAILPGTEAETRCWRPAETSCRCR